MRVMVMAVFWLCFYRLDVPTVFLSLNSCLVEYRHEIMGTQCIIIQSTTILAVFPPNSITVF